MPEPQRRTKGIPLFGKHEGTYSVVLKPEIYDKLQAMEKGGIIRIKVLREESVNHNLENPVKAYLDYIPPDDVQAAVKASQPSKVQAESDGV